MPISLDASSHAINTRLRIGSAARRNSVSGGKISLARHAAMDVLDYQLLQACKALDSRRGSRSRILTHCAKHAGENGIRAMLIY